MVRPDMEKWGQTLADLRLWRWKQRLHAGRERFLALYMIADRQRVPVPGHGKPIAPRRQFSSGCMTIRVGSRGGVLSVIREDVALFSPEQVQRLVSVVCETEPEEHGLPGHGWTLKKLQHWLKQVMGYDLARSTLHRILTSSAVALEEVPK